MLCSLYVITAISTTFCESILYYVDKFNATTFLLINWPKWHRTIICKCFLHSKNDIQTPF